MLHVRIFDKKKNISFLKIYKMHILKYHHKIFI